MYLNREEAESHRPFSQEYLDERLSSPEFHCRGGFAVVQPGRFQIRYRGDLLDGQGRVQRAGLASHLHVEDTRFPGEYRVHFLHSVRGLVRLVRRWYAEYHLRLRITRDHTDRPSTVNTIGQYLLIVSRYVLPRARLRCSNSLPV